MDVIRVNHEECCTNNPGEMTFHKLEHVHTIARSVIVRKSFFFTTANFIEIKQPNL
jgi:hypothetical protein